jgi:FkbM family methyltransferase
MAQSGVTHAPSLMLRALLAFTRRLPRIKGAGRIANWIKKFYLRNHFDPVDVMAFGVNMRLYPFESSCEGAALFYPQLWDRMELGFLREQLVPGDVFLDVGANVGIYSLVASQYVGEKGLALAIEADPYTFDKLNVNLGLNSISNILPLHMGVSDTVETLRLGISRDNRGSNSFLADSAVEGVDVDCGPLSQVVNRSELKERRIKIAKFDIEGFEWRVLGQFFKDVAPEAYPEYIIIEHHPRKIEGDIAALLQGRGYHVLKSSGLNYVWRAET